MLQRLLLLSCTCLVTVSALAADLKVLSAGAVGAPVAKLAQSQPAGTVTTIAYETVGGITARITAGEKPDVVIMTTEAISELIQQGRIVAGSRRDLGQVGVGVVVRDGTPSPDIGSIEALRKTLLAAPSIAYVDPTRGTSGKHFASVLQQLGIADAVQSKIRLITGGSVVAVVITGEAALGVQQISEILPYTDKGVRLVGPLPAGLQKITTYTAAVMNTSIDPQAAQRFIDQLVTPQAKQVFASAGFDTPGL